jgi:hypothetical protein
MDVAWLFPLMMLAFCALVIGAMRGGFMGCCGVGFGSGPGETHRLPAPTASHQPRTSGNQAFDEYRAGTLRRLEEEQREFRDFLSRLRRARDKVEFDQFMAGRPT